ncbi:hypothetical protein PAXRUDRAFT_823872 [Paxillus rubicundulus Ve08.2h10]|uniref:Unplaced genomic scaffold scaffold_70, whole genome shotgun sequence n=1 Tax=Paxillus rubicundulus Ve08.2h10 TaxID=930991 RepID=A0A0D0DV42_9AGAM|nr:hypothetical protein PAXRUDRAFT_823872 [Paxillus rubicundulus Ve08.2h10]
MSSFTSLRLVPQEVLEHIAFFTATHSLLGPPSDLLPLLRTCRSIYQCLSFEANPYLYARVFEYKFDTRAAIRRLGPHVNTPRVLANELRKRWTYLKPIKTRSGSRVPPAGSTQLSPAPIDLLWLAYLMMLENDGKNEQQLRDYAHMDSWLMEYWFDDKGASSATHMILRDTWPPEDDKNSIAMWLFWFMLRLDFLQQSLTKYRDMTTVLKLTALAANRYPICQPSWAEFVPESTGVTSLTPVTHFSQTYRLKPPSLAAPAILSFITLAMRILVPKSGTSSAASHLPRTPASLPLSTRSSEEWDSDWQRCINLGRANYCRTFSGAYTPGSIEGVWEGLFTYTEFAAYSSLLSGGAPAVLCDSLVAQHRQTWKLREYHLIELQDLTGKKTQPLELGDPLKAYFPSGTRMTELSDSAEVHEPGRGDILHYWRPSHAVSHDRQVIDIIVLGEGHSAWGQFSLYGRVRPWDGFITFTKEYARIFE